MVTADWPSMSSSISCHDAESFVCPTLSKQAPSFLASFEVMDLSLDS
jgi:hypothetical protein